MSQIFSFDVSWLPPSYGAPSVSGTAANLTIRVRNQIATRNDDDWSRSIETSARLALYPLACWLAASWWRLRWEPEPSSQSSPGPGWRLAHELPASGEGFLWPNLTFASDSQSIQVSARSTNPLSQEPIRFLADFTEIVPADLFEQQVDELIALVLARLRSLGVEDTGLEGLWNDVHNERRDPEVTTLRRFEAALGFDPLEAPQPLLDRMISLFERAGQQAAGEIAPACAGPDPAGVLATIERIAASPGIKSNPGVAGSFRGQASKPSGAYMPWEQGRSLARTVRSSHGWNGQPLTDKEVASLLGITEAVLKHSSSTDTVAPVLGLAVHESEMETRLHFRKRNRPGRRFEAARLFCDEVIAPDDDTWHPSTDCRTSRQKIQRVFAAELLCPIASLDEFLSGSYTEEKIEDAAEHFGISALAVSSHLKNNKRTDRWANSL